MSWNIHSFNFSYRDANVTKNAMDEKKKIVCMRSGVPCITAVFVFVNCY